MIRFFTFSQFHNKIPPVGSTNIRVNQLIKYWPEADLYKYGENPDVLIFQKVYSNFDYQFPAHFENIKILDICDPDWTNVYFVRRTVDVMDAVTCPTQTMADFISQFTDKPVRVIPDRFDLEVIPEPKVHKGKAKTVVWFGYRHNAEVLKSALNKIRELELNLLIIADDDPMVWQWFSPDIADKFRRARYTFVKYNDETIYEEIQKADIGVFPQGFRPEDKFKSNNKTIKTQLAGVPVATDAESLEHFMDAHNRNMFVKLNHATIKEQYDVRNSLKEYKELIDEIIRSKTKS